MTRRELSNPWAEAAILGALLTPGSERHVEAVATLEVEDFATEDHRLIYGVILDLLREGSAVEVSTVVGLLSSRAQLDDAGGVDGIGNLMSLSSTSPDATRSHVATVQGVGRLRRIHGACRAIVADVEDPSVDAAGIVDHAAQRLMDAAASKGSSRMVTTAEVTHEAWDALQVMDEAEDGVVGAPTGMGAIDRLTGGLKPGELWVVAARPSVGKTAWAVQACLAMGQRGLGSALISLEMPAKRIMHRMWAHEANANLRLPRGPEESTRLGKAITRVQSMPIRILDAHHLGIVELRAKVQAAHRASPLAAVVVDYLGLMQHPKADRHDLRIGETTRALKIMSREFGLAVVCLHQLSREHEKQNRPPVLSDLRDSGSIEQDADVIVFLHVPDKQREESLHWIVAKNREGRTGGVVVSADRGTGRFYSVGV